MTWPTHTLFGISTLWLLAWVPPGILGANWGALAAIAALGALLPDLDASESKIKHLKIPNTQIKPFLLPAIVAGKTDRHRGLLHSMAGLGFISASVAIPICVSIGWALAFAFVLGYASHLVADATTKSGIQLFYPKGDHFFLLPKNWRFTTGSIAEEALIAPLAASVFLLLLLLLMPSA